MDFLNNASVGAAVGAILAFVLFLATAPIVGFWRKRRIHENFIPNLLTIDADLCKRKIQMTERLLEGSRSNPPAFTPTLMNPFEVETLKKFEVECLSDFSTIEKRAFDAICFHMQEVDSILRSAASRVEGWRNGERKPVDTRTLLLLLAEDYGDALLGLRAIETWLSQFQDGDFEAIVESEHSVPAKVVRPIKLD